MKWYYLIALLFIIPSVAGYTLELTFVDEDNNVLLNSNGLSVLVNATSCTITNGTCVFDAGNSVTAEVTAAATDYATRSYTFGRDKAVGDVNRTLTLLKSIDGTPIPFKLRVLDGTSFVIDANVTVLHADNNYIAGRSVIGADSLFDDFLSPFKQDYIFVVESESSGDFNYVRNFATVLVPKNEATLANITPFDVRMLGIGTDLRLTSTVDQNFRVFPFTTSYYIADVNATRFFNRNYYFRLERGNFDQNIILEDTFTGADGSAPNTSNWFIFADGAGDIVDIEDNDLNIFAPNSNVTAAVISDINVLFNIGDVKDFEFTSVERPVGAGSEQYGGGWMVDNNVNPQTAEITFKINRGDTGVLTLYHGTTSVSSQLDGGTGEKNFKIRVTRTSDTVYTSEFFIDDTNLMQTFTDTGSHNLYKVALFARSGSGNATGKFDNAKLSTSNAFEIQPYLASIETGRQIIVEISSSFNPTLKLGDIRILSETNIEGAGLQQVETVVSDSKGQGIMSFIIGQEYTLSFFDDAGLLLDTKTVVIGPTTTIVSLSIELEPLFGTPLSKTLLVSFIPAAGILQTNQIVEVITFFDANISVTDINIIISQNDINLFSIDGNLVITTSTVSGFASRIINNISLSNATISAGRYSITANIIISDGNSFWLTTTYQTPVTIGGVDLLNGIIRGQIKTDFGCTPNSSDEFCYPLMVISLMFSILGTVAISMNARVLNINTSVFVFLAVLALFTYWFWFPWQLFTGMSLFGIVTTWGLFKR